MKQGEIWYADLNPVKGSEQSGRRPIVIVSGDTLNDTLPIIIVVPLTSKIKSYPTCVLINPNRMNGLKKSAEAIPFQVRTIAKKRLTKPPRIRHFRVYNKGMRAKQMRQGLIIGVLFIVALWLVSLILGLAGKVQVALREAHNAQADYAALEARRQTLEASISALSTTKGKDAAIRTAFGVARPGEEVIVVVPPTVATTAPQKSWMERLFRWFYRAGMVQW